MIKYLSTLLVICVMLDFSFSQGISINSNGTPPHPSAGLDINFTNKGLLLPRLTQLQRDSISNPADGLVIYNVSSSCINFFSGGLWLNICGSSPVAVIQSIDCNNIQNFGNLVQNTNSVNVYSLIPFQLLTSGIFNSQSVNSSGVLGLSAILVQDTLTTNGYIRMDITGTPSSSGNAIFNFNINGFNCQIIRTVSQLPFVCGTSSVTFSYKGSMVTYGTVLGTNNRCWLDRNLGASQIASTRNDSQSYGDFFQWGRGDDGHQNPNSNTTGSLSINDQPGHGEFIVLPSLASYINWRQTNNDNLWQGVNGINNPCPSGFRIPTQSEFQAEVSSWILTNYTGAFASNLKLTTNGFRVYHSALITNAGTSGFYWTSTVDPSPRVVGLIITSNAATLSNQRDKANGFGVRCIKD